MNSNKLIIRYYDDLIDLQNAVKNTISENEKADKIINKKIEGHKILIPFFLYINFISFLNIHTLRN